MSRITVGGRTVTSDGAPVAHLSYSGRSVTVTRLNGTVAGRLLRVTDSGPYRYDAYSAEHPVAPVPSDRLLGARLLVASAVQRVLDQEEGQ